MLWEIENDPNLQYRQEYFDAMVKLCGNDNTLILVKIKENAPEFEMGHKTAKRMNLSSLPECLQEVVNLTIASFNADAPYVFLVSKGAGWHVNRHFHKDFSGVSSFQPVVVLSEKPVTGVTFGNNTKTLTTNRALINVREWHWVEPQESNNIWVSIIAGIW